MLQEFTNYLTSIKGYSENTATAYRKDLNQFARWAMSQPQGLRWSTITRETLDQYITDEVARGMKPATTNRRLAAISQLYNYFKRQGLDVENPCRYESRRKVGERVPNTINYHDLETAYEKSYGLTRYMLGILCTTGCRLQELLDLEWQDINFETGAIKLHGKGKRERVVYTLQQVTDDLEPLYTYGPKTGKVFTIDQRTARRYIYDALNKVSRAAQKSPHAIRHTIATRLAERGVNTTTLQAVLGHQDIRTTQKYIDFGVTNVQAALNNNSIFN